MLSLEKRIKTRLKCEMWNLTNGKLFGEEVNGSSIYCQNKQKKILWE